MSGPWPVLAATEALGWMSSKDSLVTLTGTPVALVKASTRRMKASSSAGMKRFQRRSLSEAPASGFHWLSWAQARAKPSRPAAEARPRAAPALRIWRRSKADIVACLPGLF